VYEWVIENRKIPVVPIFVNAYLRTSDSPAVSRLGRVIAKVIAARPNASPSSQRGMSHFPARGSIRNRFRLRLLGHRPNEKGNHEALLSLTSEQLDLVATRRCCRG